MNWTEFAYWLRLIDELRVWLLGIEPAFFHASGELVRIALILIFVRFSLWLIIGAIRLLAILVYVILSLVAYTGARWLIYSSVGTMAHFYVQIEAAVLRLAAPLIEDITNLIDSEESADEYEADEYEEGEKGLIEPEPLGLLPRVARMIVMYILVLPLAFVFVVAGDVLRNLIRITIFNIASLVITLWLSGLLRNLSNIVSDAPFREVTVSTIVTSGALLALLFVALNADVRGKAELNKVASLACRTALHKSTPKLLRLAEALEVIRVRASKKLRYFPTTFELFELTGRNDLCWRGSHLLPLTTEPGSAWTPLASPTCEIRRSILVKKDVEDQNSVIKSDSKAIRAIFVKLHESGMDEKLSRVLNRPSYFHFERFHKKRFKPDVTPAVHFDNGDSWRVIQAVA